MLAPTPHQYDAAYAGNANAVVLGYICSRHIRGDFPNDVDLFIGKFGKMASFSSRESSMCKLVRLVFFRCFPIQMIRSDAAKMAIAARVGGVMFRGWRRAVYFLAHDAMDLLRLPFPMDCSPSKPSLCIRPSDTVITGISLSLKKERHWQASFNRAGQRVAMALPTTVMTTTHSTDKWSEPAIFNNAHLAFLRSMLTWVSQDIPEVKV